VAVHDDEDGHEGGDEGSTTIQAPCENFVTAIVTMTTPVTSAPTPLSAMRHHQPEPRTRSQRRTMLPCESVNDTNTPTA